MTVEERQAYIRQLVDAAPPLSREDADLIRTVMPLRSRLVAEQAPERRLQQTRRNAA
ncbi:hypothetical protein ACKI10_15160 [Streptomyces galilaeus]|uniref:Uncharacterized protein n=1 Tax=Streptomyces galilaeus TaxID=33899 RepID=A0ABW9IJ90_STRGJ